MEIWLVAGVAVVVAVAAYALLTRRSGQVIDAPRQASAPASAPAAASSAAREDQSAGDMLSAEGLDPDDPLVYFADWLESEAVEELGTAVEQPGPTRRIADAARAAMPLSRSAAVGMASARRRGRCRSTAPPLADRAGLYV